MPDMEKVISILSAYKNHSFGDKAEKVTVEEIITLLKAQEPIEPVIVNGEPECAECLYELRSDADSYCPCCGRKVKWE